MFTLCEEIEKDRENIRSAALISQQGQSSIIESNGESSNHKEKRVFLVFLLYFSVVTGDRSIRWLFFALYSQGLTKFNIYMNDSCHNSVFLALVISL